MLKHYLKKIIRQGCGFRKAFTELQKSLYFSKEQIQHLQNQKLQKIIHHCYKNVPYYTDLFNSLKLKPEDVMRVEDLIKLPLLDKTIVRENFDKLIAKNKPRFLTYTTLTSGTTGMPGKIIWDKKSIDWEYAVVKRFYGDNIGRKIVLRGNLIKPVENNTPPFWKQEGNELALSSYHLNANTAPFYLEKIKEFKPEILEAYPSSAYLLAKYCAGEIKFKAVFTSSEMLPDDKRRVIEDTFKSPVFDWYGQVERVAAIGQCAKGTHHIQEDYSIVEILENEIVGTHLYNYSMPLIRYKTNDTVELGGEICPCGCAFRSVSKIYGKNSDNYCIFTKDGEKFSAFGFIPRGVQNIIETQFVQERIGELIINVTTNGKFSSKDKEQLIKNAIERTAPDMKILVNEVSNIARGPNGKFLIAINKVAK